MEDKELTIESNSKVIAQLARIEALLQEDHNALRGNGHKGALDRLTDLENKVESVDRRQAELSSFISCVSDLKADIKVLTTTVNGLTEQVKAIPQMLSDIEMLKGKRVWWRDLIAISIAAMSMLVAAYAVFK